jgi:head-tail adaptor
MLTDVCTIQRKTASVGSNGFASQTWATSSSGVACAIQAKGSKEDRRNRRETGVSMYTVYLPYGTDVRAADRILGTTGQTNGLTLSVVSTPIDNAGQTDHLVIECIEVKGGGTL